MKTTTNQSLADAAASFIAKNTATKSSRKRVKGATSKKSKAALKKATRKTSKAAAPKTSKREPTKKAAPKRTAKPTDRDPRLPAIGTKLTRTFKGEQVVVKVVDGGFEYQGGTFTSVSAVARHITGYAISGPVFFHLVDSKRGKTEEK